MTSVVALDVNETLSDMSALGSRLEEVGASAGLLELWFASTLRDGFALTLAGGYADFGSVARATLRPLLAAVPSLTRKPDTAASYVLSGLPELPLHEDVAPGLKRLHAAGIKLVTLTNGSAESTRHLLERGGGAAYIEEFLSVEEVRRWKPAREPYHLVSERCGVRPEDVLLAAVHPWDLDGAKRAGLAGAWINRSGDWYPPVFSEPELICADFNELADVLLSRDVPRPG